MEPDSGLHTLPTIRLKSWPLSSLASSDSGCQEVRVDKPIESASAKTSNPMSNCECSSKLHQLTLCMPDRTTACTNKTVFQHLHLLFVLWKGDQIGASHGKRLKQNWTAAKSPAKSFTLSCLVETATTPARKKKEEKTIEKTHS